MNKHDRKRGDKIELVETAGLSLVDMKIVVEDVYNVDADEARVMRLDVAADIEGTPVQWFRNYTQVRGKQTFREWGVQNVSSRTAETLYAGQKPNQLRIYNKTAHRRLLMQKEVLKLPKECRDAAMSFEDRWGYPESRIITRVERQIGGPAPKRAHLEFVAQIRNLDSMDPFTQLVFREEWTPKKPIHFKGKDYIVCDHLARMVRVDGITHTRNYMRAAAGSRNAFYTMWNRYKEFLGSVESADAGEKAVTRKDLLESFRTTIHHQLKQAA
jgi:hypothetical protein